MLPKEQFYKLPLVSYYSPSPPCFLCMPLELLSHSENSYRTVPDDIYERCPLLAKNWRNQNLVPKKTSILQMSSLVRIFSMRKTQALTIGLSHLVLKKKLFRNRNNLVSSSAGASSGAAQDGIQGF